MNKLQKKLQQLENDFDQVQEALLTANNNAVEKDKALANVSCVDVRSVPPTHTLEFPLDRGGDSHNAEEDAAGRE